MILSKKRILAFTILAFYLLSPVTTWACTSIIVGKNASATGRAMVARTVDGALNFSNKLVVIPRGFFKGGVDYLLDRNGFTFKFSHDSYKYTAAPFTTRSSINNNDMTEATSKDYGPPLDGYSMFFDESGVNEKGLIVSATNTSGFRAGTTGTGGRDPSGLWREETMAKVLLAEAASVQEALDVIDSIVSYTGSNGLGMDNSLILLADKDEAWIAEGIGGHHWVASRVPDDCFGMVANDITHKNIDLSDTKNFRGSPDYMTFAVSYDIDRYQDGEFNIALTYGNAPAANTRGTNGQYNAYRKWRGYSMFAPSLGLNVLTADDYLGKSEATSKDTGKSYTVFIKPDKPISPMDIAFMQRDRYAGLPFDYTYSPQIMNGINEVQEATTDPYFWVRPIGYLTQIQTHIFEAGTQDYPAEIGSRFWHSMAQAETSVNLPFYGNITDTHPYYKKDIIDTNDNLVTSYVDDCAYWLFAATGRLARSDRRNYAAPIKAFWRNHELKLFEDQQRVIEPELLRLYKEVSPEASAKFITDYTIAVSDRTFRAAQKIHDALVAHIAAAPNTLFAIPAELLEPTINDSVLLNPTAADMKAAGEAQSGLGLLTRDDGNVKVSANGFYPNAPKGYKSELAGVNVEVTLKPEQLTAKQTAAKLLYEFELNGIDFAAYGGLHNFVKNLKLVMSVGSDSLNLVGPGSGSLISFSDALDNGIASITMTSGGAIVALEYILADGPGDSGAYNGKLVAFDGVANGVLNGTIWTLTPTIITAVPDPCSDDGCNAGLGYVALGLFGMLIFARKRSR